jgi:hypothetical protein
LVLRGNVAFALTCHAPVLDEVLEAPGNRKARLDPLVPDVQKRDVVAALPCHWPSENDVIEPRAVLGKITRGFLT